tara:strand:+ start:166 stop:2607 length:2442 start_codon:yes stop_codon:yes gene_type:complete
MNFINNFIKFTCENLVSTGVKEDGTHAKKPVGMPSWKKGGENTPLEDYYYSNDYYEFKYYPPDTTNEHNVICILTGKINNITVFDFDDNNEYYKFIEKYPEFKDALTVKTSKGFHIYCKYNPTYKTTTGKNKIDIRNDRAIVFGQGTKTDFDTSYDYYYGDKIDIEMPYEFYKYVVPNEIFKSKPNKKEKVMCKPSINEMSLQPITEDDDILLQYCECIDIADIDNYNTWVKLVWSLHQHKDIARKLSRMGNNYNEDSFEKTYLDYKDRGLTIKTFYEFAKKGNRDKYFDVLNNDPNKKEIEKNNEIDVELWTNGEDIDIGDDLFQLFGDDFIYIYKQLYFWNSNVNRWVKDDEYQYILNYIINKITEAYDKYLTSKDYFNIIKTGDDVSKKLQNIWGKSKKLKQMKNIKPIRERFINRLINRFDKIEFDMNPYLIAFDNTVYDFETEDKTQKIRTAKKTDYISMNTNYNYEPPTTEQKKTIKKIIESIFPDEEQRRCYMSVLYNGLIGICPEKFIIANGSGRNGKGVLNDLILSLLGDYGYKGNSDTLIEKLKTGANPEVAKLDKVRFALFSEPDIRHQLNTATIKQLSGGGEINARDLYSSKTKTILNAVIVLEANAKPQLNGTDSNSDALRERIVDVIFNSRFIAQTKDEEDVSNNIFKQDPRFKDHSFQREHRCALFDYITNYEGVEKIYVSTAAKNDSSKYLLGGDVVYTFVNELIEPVDDKDSVVRIIDLYDAFKTSECYINMERVEKRKYGKSFFTNEVQKHIHFRKFYKERYEGSECKKRYGCCLIRNVLTNFKMIEQEKMMLVY